MSPVNCGIIAVSFLGGMAFKLKTELSASITDRLCGRKRNRLSSRQNSRYAACSSRFHAEHHHYCCTLRGGRRTVHCCGRHAGSLCGVTADGREWCRGRGVGPPWRARRPRSPGVPAHPDLATRKNLS